MACRRLSTGDPNCISGAMIGSPASGEPTWQADMLKAEMTAIVDKHPKKILADFSLVQYVDSSFLGALVSSLKYAVANGCDIAVINLPRDIHDLFSLIRLDKVFKIYVSLAEALADVN